jgi:excisionase family DNA binding protein
MNASRSELTTFPANEPANTNEEAPAPLDPAVDQAANIIALGMLTGGLNVYQQLLVGGCQQPAFQLSQPPSEIMTADEVAAFLGVDRNTVYDYAGRGLIPHQRLGKRILFARGALLSWLDSCKATSTRKG